MPCVTGVTECHVLQAKKIFSTVCPGEEFIPRPPDPEDIIFCDDETKKQSAGESFTDDADQSTISSEDISACGDQSTVPGEEAAAAGDQPTASGERSETKLSEGKSEASSSSSLDPEPNKSQSDS